MRIRRKPRRLLELLPPGASGHARVYHGTSGPSWEDSFYHAVRYAGRAGSEVLMLLLREACRIVDGPDADADRFVINYASSHQLDPVVLALQLPFEVVPAYGQEPDPDASWRHWHPPGVALNINMGIEAPISIERVVGVVDPADVSPLDRDTDPSQANGDFLLSIALPHDD